MVNVFINSLVYDGNFGLIKTQVWTDSTVFVPDNTIFLQFKNCNLPSGFYEVKIDWGVAGNPATWVFEQPTYFGIP